MKIPASSPYAREDDWLHAHFAAICQKRGVANFYERFVPDAINVGEHTLRLDVIEVDKDAPSVVFMPGTNAYALLYGEFLTALADRGYNVVGFDPRGHGQSTGARGSYTLAELVTDMEAVVSYTRSRFGGPVVVSGSSQGGITAFYLAAKDPTLAGALCHNIADLSDPSSVVLTRFPRVARWGKPFLLQLARIFPESKVPMLAYLDLKKEPVRGMGNAHTVLSQDPLLSSFVRVKTMASLGTEPLACPLEAIQTPIFLLHAEADTIFPLSYIEALYKRLTCPKQLKVYPELPHYMIVDHVGHFIDDAAAWLQEVTAKEGQEG